MIVLGVVLTVGAIAPGVAPLVLATPDSGSMSPAAEPHSLVVLTDTEPAVGEVALYRTPTRDQAVLHRLVDTTGDDETFLTKGDANDVIDQRTGDPPVSRSEIYGTVPTVGGHPFVVPYAGVALTNPVVGFGAWALLGLSLLYSTTGGQVVRETVTVVPLRTYVVLFAVAVTILLPIVTVGAPATVQTEILTTTTASEEMPHLVEPGEVGERTIEVSSPVIRGLRTTAHVEGDLQVTSVEDRPDEGVRRITVANDPVDAPQVHRGTVTVYSYPAIWPTAVLRKLAAIHPAVAAFASSLPIGASMLSIGLLVTDPKLPLRASRKVIRRRRQAEKRTRNHLE